MLRQVRYGNNAAYRYVSAGIDVTRIMRSYFEREINGITYGFSRVNHAHEVLYYISASAADYTVKFKMRRKYEDWKIITGGLPLDIYIAEGQLSYCISDEEAMDD